MFVIYVYEASSEPNNMQCHVYGKAAASPWGEAKAILPFSDKAEAEKAAAAIEAADAHAETWVLPFEPVPAS